MTTGMYHDAFAEHFGYPWTNERKKKNKCVSHEMINAG